MHIKEEAIESAEWLRAARGYEVKVLMEDGDIAKFDGFKESVCMQDEVNVLMYVCVCVCVCVCVRMTVIVLRAGLSHRERVWSNFHH